MKTFNQKLVFLSFFLLLICMVQYSYSEEGPCICTMDYRPVCGTDGKTYGNKCQLDCEKKKPGHEELEVKHTGKC